MLQPDVVLSTDSVRGVLRVGVEANIPVLLWGPPGEGKSRTVESVAAGLGRTSETVIGSIREASDFAGLPERGPEGIILHAPRWAHRAAAAERAVVFLDELTTATPPVQAAMLRIVLDREVGDLRLPNSVSVVAAANPPDVAADGYDLAPPLANRFCHVWFEADVAGWTDGMVNGWPTVGHKPPRIPGESELAAWRARVAAYIQMRPTMLRASAKQMTADVAFPSPRSWDMVARISAFAYAAEVPDEIVWTLVAGCVGAGGAHEFLANVHMAGLPDPEDLLAGTASLDPAWRQDEVLAVVGAIVAAVRAQCDQERWREALTLLDRTADSFGDDIAALGVTDLLVLRGPAWPLPPSLRRFEQLLAQAGE